MRSSRLGRLRTMTNIFQGVSRNGSQHPPRPRIELVTGAASSEEAAAITAAKPSARLAAAALPIPSAVSRLNV